MFFFTSQCINWLDLQFTECARSMQGSSLLLCQEKLVGFCMAGQHRLGSQSIVPSGTDEGIFFMVGSLLLADEECRAEVERQLSPFVISPLFLEECASFPSAKERLLDIIGSQSTLRARRKGVEKRLCDIVWDIRNEVFGRWVSRMNVCSWDEPVNMELAIDFELVGCCLPEDGCLGTMHGQWDYNIPDHVHDSLESMMAQLQNGNCGIDTMARITELLVLQACVFPICTDENKVLLTKHHILDMMSDADGDSIFMWVCHGFNERMALLLQDTESGDEWDTCQRASSTLDACVRVSECKKKVGIVFNHSYMEDELSEACKCRWCSDEMQE